jgi:hypothetical protein
MRYELNDREWAAIKPMLPNKPRGVPRVNDRRVLNGIFWVPHLYRISCPLCGGGLRPCQHGPVAPNRSLTARSRHGR